jgi:glycosyltransferase involved in cell wall biosynthesis
MNTQPLISVIMPAYNAAAYIEEAIRSVLAQTYLNIEVVVIDDGSTDASGDIARSISDSRVRVVSKPNGGVSSARNAGLDIAQGEYVAFHDADDTMEPTNLAEKVEALVHHDVDWVFGDLILCDPIMRPTAVMKGTDDDVVRTILLGIDTAVPGTSSNVVLKRSCFDGGYRFPSQLSNAADQHLVLSMAKDHRYHHLPRALTLYRVLSTSMSKNVALYEADHLRLFKAAEEMGLLDDPGFARTCTANKLWSIGGSWWVNGRSPMKAIPYMVRAVLTDPAVLLRYGSRKQRK